MSGSEPKGGMVIAGAGECGGRAALALRGLGYAGPVTLIGEEPLAPYERPPLSKGLLSPDAGPKWITPFEDYATKDIALLTGVAVTSIDRARKVVCLRDGREIGYQRLLLATGARPRPLPGASFDGARILSLRSHADAQALQSWLDPARHVAILGGGFIGLELAATARLAGAKVTVLEGLPRVLMRGVPEVLALALQERHRAEGVDLRLGVRIERVEPQPDGIRVVLADDPPIDADVLLVGIGAIPNTELAERAGLAVENGIVADGRLFTSDPDILAAGDCCNFPLAVYDGRHVRLESWRSAQEQAALAAENMMGAARELSSVPWFWSDQYDLSLQVAGLTDQGTYAIDRPVDDGGLILFHLDADGRLVAASGLGRGNSVARDIRLAEMLIANRAHPDPGVLRDPASKLKSLLRAA